VIVKRLTAFNLLLRVLIPLVLVPLLGITPRAQRVAQRLSQAQRALGYGSQLAAAEHLARVAELEPWRAGLWERAGMYALEGGDAQAASVYFERAADAGQLSPGGALAMGDALEQLGQFPAAIEAWQSAQAGGGDPVSIYKRVLKVQMQLQDYTAARFSLEQLVRWQPAEPDWRYRLGLLLAAQDPEVALVHLSGAADLDPNLVAPTQKLRAAIQRGRLSEDRAVTLLEAGRALGAIGEWELAAEAFYQATQARPDYPDAWAFLAEARQQVGGEETADQAWEALQTALQLESDSLVANTLAALYWQRQRRYDFARAHLQSVTDLYPRNPALWVELGHTLALDGDLAAALDAYQQAVSLAHRDADYYRYLADFTLRYQYHLGEVGLAAARQAVVLEPRDPAALDTMGAVLLRLGDLTSAERFLQRALEIDPNYAQAHLDLGLVYALQGDMAPAFGSWQRAATLEPDSAVSEQARRLIKNYFPRADAQARH